MSEKTKQVPLWFYIKCGAYSGIISALLREIFNKGLSIPLPVTEAFSMLFIGLTAYPLFFRHIPNRWSKDNKPLSFSVWVLISVLFSILQFGLFYSKLTEKIISFFP